MAKNLGDYGTKIYYFIRKNKAENGPLEFRTVLCSNYDEKLGNLEKKTPRYKLYFSLPSAKNGKKPRGLRFSALGVQKTIKNYQIKRLSNEQDFVTRSFRGVVVITSV
jgi:hypothetical protein